MKKLALCIGNDDYEILPRLNCCIADAIAIEEQLKNLGFDTILKTNLNRENLADEILGFVEQIRQYDAVLLYYAGHGFQADGDNILAPIDLNVNNRPAAVRLSAFTLSELMNQLNRFPAQTKIVILDACRETLGYRGTFQDFAPVSAPQGSVIAFATSPGQSSKENAATGHGRYTEALLQYITLPRVPVETVFKKVRESLVVGTGGTQIPWEHTSLIGEFYFNPDTIYDGVSYSWEAKADSKFHFLPDSEVRSIVEGLKTYNWPQQETAISKVTSIDFFKASSNELFVLGRNIYQAACGSSFACLRFINNFGTTKYISDQAKVHILNGMAYEIYYDARNNLRSKYKTSCLASIVNYLEQPEFYASREFIGSHLCKIEDRPIYIPGQNERMFFIVKGKATEDGYQVEDISYHGKSVYFNAKGTEYVEADPWTIGTRCFTFEQSVISCVAAPSDCVQFQYDDPTINHESELLIPYEGFSIRFKVDSEEDE